jgi:hypothetical protein
VGGCIDGAAGRTCNETTEYYCPNQCTGANGACFFGFCKCAQGWFGTDCSMPTAAVAGANASAVLEELFGEPPPAAGLLACLAAGCRMPGPLPSAQPRPDPQPAAGALALPPCVAALKPYLRDVVALPPTLRSPPPARKRPLIYVYNLPPAYNTRMLQYRIVRCACALGGPQRLAAPCTCCCTAAACTLASPGRPSQEPLPRPRRHLPLQEPLHVALLAPGQRERQPPDGLL